MKKTIAFSLLAASLAACQTSSLKGRAHSSYVEYLNKSGHKAFFVHQTHDGGFVTGYHYNNSSRMSAYLYAQRHCNKQFDKINFRGKCQAYDIDGIKVSSFSKEEIQNLLSEKSSPIKMASKTQRIDVFRKLEDGRMVFKGSMAPTTSGRSKLVVTLADAKCTGEGVYIKGSYNTDTLPQGTWNLHCNNGRFASGTYISTELHTGTATGIDDTGEKINLVYRPNDL